MTHLKVVFLSEYKDDWMANPLTRRKPFLSLLGRSDILVKSTENQYCHNYFQSWFWPVIGANLSTSQPVPSGNPLSLISRLLWGETWHWTPAVQGTLTVQQLNVWLWCHDHNYAPNSSLMHSSIRGALSIETPCHEETWESKGGRSREKDGRGGFAGGLCAAGAEGEQQSLLICLFALGDMWWFNGILSFFLPSFFKTKPKEGAVTYVGCVICQKYFPVSFHKFLSHPIKYKVIALSLYGAWSYKSY